MNNQQQKTLEQFFANPVNGTLAWRKIEALLLAVGRERTEGSGSSVTLAHSGMTVRFQRPHPQREALRYWVSDARRFLQEIGVIPFPFHSESRRTDKDSALARLGGATTYPIEMEME